jgi:protein-disulfide isomerase
MTKDGKKIFKGDVYDINKSPFQANIDKLDVKGAPSLGPATAPIALVVFSDFQCPMCRQEAEVIHKQIGEAFPTQVRVYFRDFPIESLHNWARPAAVAGRCVFKLKPAAFWDYYDWVYENQTYIGLDNLNSKIQEFAAAKNLDGMQLSRCIESKVTDPEVKASLAIATSLSLSAAPTIFLDGRRLEGAVPWETLQTLIKMELDHQAKAAAVAAKDDSCCTVTIPKIVK